jgi:hypothetical protein
MSKFVALQYHFPHTSLRMSRLQILIWIVLFIEGITKKHDAQTNESQPRQRLHDRSHALVTLNLVVCPHS